MRAAKALLLVRTAAASGAGAALGVIESIYLRSLGLPPALVGAYIGASTLVSALSSYLLSAVADAYGRKRMALASSAVPVAGLLALYMGVAAGILLVYLGPGGAYSALYAESAEDPDRDWSHLSIVSVSASAAGSLLPAALSMRDTIAAATAVYVAGTLALAWIRERYRGKGRVELRMASAGTLARLSSAAIIGLGAGIVLPMLPLWLDTEYGVGPGPIGVLMSAQSAAMALAFWLAPRISGRLGRLRTIVATQAAGVALLSLFPLSPTFPVAAALWTARSVAMNMANPLYYALVNELIPEGERARGNSALQLLDSVPRSAGPYFTGVMMSRGEMSAPFFVTAALYGSATTALYALLRGRTK
ncbi:MAG: MFS transporter [Conexivisphaera sp.]